MGGDAGYPLLVFSKSLTVLIAAALAVGAWQGPAAGTDQGRSSVVVACPNDGVLELLHDAVFFLEHRRDLPRVMRDLDEIPRQLRPEGPGRSMALGFALQPLSAATTGHTQAPPLPPSRSTAAVAPSRPTDPEMLKAYDVLERHCARCHHARDFPVHQRQPLPSRPPTDSPQAVALEREDRERKTP